VALLNETTAAFHYDLRSDIDELAEDLKKAARGQPPLDDFNDHLKSGIRSLCGQMEAVAYCLTKAVLSDAPKATLTIRNEDLAVLEERDYDPDTDTCSPRCRRYPLSRRFEVACRHFLSLCGANVRDPIDPATAQHLQLLTRARNNFTHPTRLEHMIVTPAFEHFRQIAYWFPAQSIHVLSAAAETLGLPAPHRPPPMPPTPLLTFSVTPEDVFDRDFYHRVFSDPSIAIKYIRFFSQQLHDELTRAFDRCRDALFPPYQLLPIGRAVRRMIRAMTTNAEGTMGFAAFFMRALRRFKGGVSVPQHAKGASVPERLLDTLSAFSNAFGSGAPLTKDASWAALCATFKIRDRLTHPKSPRHVALTVDDLDEPMKALGWLLEQAYPAAFLDHNKLAGFYAP